MQFSFSTVRFDFIDCRLLLLFFFISSFWHVSHLLNVYNGIRSLHVCFPYFLQLEFEVWIARENSICIPKRNQRFVQCRRVCVENSYAPSDRLLNESSTSRSSIFFNLQNHPSISSSAQKEKCFTCAENRRVMEHSDLTQPLTHLGLVELTGGSSSSSFADRPSKVKLDGNFTLIASSFEQTRTRCYFWSAMGRPSWRQSKSTFEIAHWISPQKTLAATQNFFKIIFWLKFDVNSPT